MRITEFGLRSPGTASLVVSGHPSMKRIPRFPTPPLLAAFILSALPAASAAPGDADPSFGTSGDGIVITPMLRYSATMECLGVQSDGKIVAAGTGLDTHNEFTV